MNRLINAGITGVLLLSLAACGTFSPRADPSRFFMLSALPQSEDPAPKGGSTSAGISLGIGPISFPGYLDRQEIVTRVAPNRIDVSENDRWAESLEANFVRTLSQNLSSLLATDRLVFYPWELNRKPNYQVEMEVLRFEADASGDVQLSARWVVMDAGKKSLQSRESRLTRPVKAKSTEASVAALSETVADLSREVAEAIRAIDAGKKQ